MKKEGTIDHRGGKRPGAGRPRTDSKLFTFRAPGPMARVIESQESKTDFIKECIVRTIQMGEPDFTKLGVVMPAKQLKDIKLPFFDIKVVAGFPIPLDNDEKAQNIALLQMLCPHPESSYLIRVQGDSMIDAGIQNGDIIIVDKSNRHPLESEPAVCELNGDYTIKYVHYREGRGVLVPGNPNYPEIPITDGDNFSVWGVVTYIIHKPQ